MSSNDQGSLRPPEYLRDNIGDLIDPRFVVLDYRRMMEPYHELEEVEANMRHQARMQLDAPLRLWLRAIALLRRAFVGGFPWPDDLPEEERVAFELREDLLGLAATSAKPTLDTLLDGYYWSAFGMIRSLLETCRRVGYVRLRPQEAPQYFEAPSESPNGEDDGRRKGPPRLDFNTIKAAYEDATREDQELFALINTGFNHMVGGAHPSAEGVLQLYLQDGRKVFGPTFDPYWAAFGLKWGVFALIMLLTEVQYLRQFEADWYADFENLGAGFKAWREEYNRTYADRSERE